MLALKMVIPNAFGTQIFRALQALFSNFLNQTLEKPIVYRQILNSNRGATCAPLFI